MKNSVYRRIPIKVIPRNSQGTYCPERHYFGAYSQCANPIHENDMFGKVVQVKRDIIIFGKNRKCPSFPHGLSRPYSDIFLVIRRS
jgi:hypothetical protein